MLYIRGLTKKYGNFLAVDNLNLHIEKGEVFGFVGPNGAGKTTTMKIVCGLLQATSGQVMVAGVDALNEPQRIKRRVGYVPDFFGVYDNLKVIEYMEFYGSMYGIPKKQANDIAQGLLELVNLQDKQDVFVDSLSRGMKQRLCVARALIHDPELLIMDEPASGLDPRARFEMKEILKNLGSMGKTIIISSHILPELAEMCTSVGVMERGRLLVAGKVEDIINRGNANRPIIMEVLGDKQHAIELLRENPEITNISVRENEILVGFTGDEEAGATLLGYMVERGIKVTKFFREKGDLETIFLDITKGGAK